MEILCVFLGSRSSLRSSGSLWTPVSHSALGTPWTLLPWVPEVLPDRLRLREYLLKERLLRLYPKIY
ncbi:hypothetical protein [Common midwife toad virus]|uniref:Uncharacterized protein n=1 Tax=Common midwife toad virus TaxID=540070 RepID=A0A2D0XME0_9VIRU|nr:hypothetical protein [Common midwife toad virus]